MWNLFLNFPELEFNGRPTGINKFPQEPGKDDKSQVPRKTSLHSPEFQSRKSWKKILRLLSCSKNVPSLIKSDRRVWSTRSDSKQKAGRSAHRSQSAFCETHFPQGFTDASWHADKRCNICPHVQSGSKFTSNVFKGLSMNILVTETDLGHFGVKRRNVCNPKAFNAMQMISECYKMTH